MLVSGADSELLVAELLAGSWTVLPLYVRCGFVWERAELPRVRRALAALRHPALRPLVVSRAPMDAFMARHWSMTGRGAPGAAAAWDSVYLPGRNMLLLTQGWLLAAARGAEAVVIGTLKGNPFPDATPRFRSAARAALNLAFGSRVRLLAPYAGLSKEQVFARRSSFPLRLAFSCLRPRGARPCGSCSKCAELRRALAADRRADPPGRRRALGHARDPRA